MIELETAKKGLKIINEGRPGELMSCPLSEAERYKEIRESVAWQEEHALDIERYYLAESDGDTWYSHREFLIRNAKIRILEERTPMDMEVEIHQKVMRQILPGAQVHELTPGQPVTPKPAEVKREAA